MIIIKIYIDFDGTLFDSTKLCKEFINIFNKDNINKLYIEKTINKAYEKDKNFDTLAKKIVKDNNLDLNILNDINNIYSQKCGIIICFGLLSK